MSTAEAVVAQKLDVKRLFFILLGATLFTLVYFSPPWPDAIDPLGSGNVNDTYLVNSAGGLILDDSICRRPRRTSWPNFSGVLWMTIGV